MMVQVPLVTDGIEQLSMVNDHLLDQLVVTCYVSHVYIGLLFDPFMEGGKV